MNLCRYGTLQSNHNLDCCYGSYIVCLAGLRGTVCFSRCRNGIMHDTVPHCQSTLFCHTWIPLRQEYPADVEFALDLFYIISCRNMAVLQHQGGVV